MHRLLIAFLLLYQATSWAHSIRQAEDFFWTGRGDAALELYQQIIMEANSSSTITDASRVELGLAVAGTMQVALRFGNQLLFTHAKKLSEEYQLTIPEIQILVARWSASRGDYQQAIQICQDILERFPHNLEAQYRLLEWMDLISPTPIEDQEYQKIIASATGSQSLSVADNEWLGRACVKIGNYEWEGAQKYYKQALDASPTLESVKIAKADLWLDRYDETHAIGIYQDVIKSNSESIDAYLGLARAYLESGNLGFCMKAVEQLLSINPNHPSALAIQADLYLYDHEQDQAIDALDRAASINPGDPDLLAVKLAYAIRARKQEELNESLSMLPSTSGLMARCHYIAAECLERNYLFRDAAAQLSQCLEFRPDNNHARASLAMLAARISPVSSEHSLPAMEQAFKKDPFHLRLFNMRNLIRKRDDFERLESEHFILRLPQGSGRIYGEFALTELENFFSDLSSRYPYHPPEKILVEIYEDPNDFSIRISGLPGAGLSGVCFGDIVILKGPNPGNRNRENWGNVLRHELTHTFTIALSDSRVPRWLTEGLSVSEEWDPRLSSDVLLASAFKQNGFIPIAQLDAAFHRPFPPTKIWIAYAQSAEVAQYLSDRFGFEKHLSLLEAFKTGDSTHNVLPRVLKVPIEELDREISDRVRRRLELKGSPDLMSTPTKPKSASPELFAASQVLSVTQPMGMKPLVHDREKELEQILKKLQESPESIPLLETKASLSYQLGNKREARKTAEKILSQTRESFVANCVLGWLARDARRWQEAVDYLLTAHHLRPRFTGPGSPLAETESILRKQRNYQKLAEVLSIRLALQPNDAGAYCELARFALTHGNTQIAENAVRQAVFIDPFLPDTQLAWGDLLRNQGKIEQARERYRVAQKLDPQSGKALLGIARVLVESGSKEGAMENARKALQLDPTLDESQALIRQLENE